MGFSISAVKELVEDISNDRKLKGKGGQVAERAMEITGIKGRNTVGPEDVERAVEQVEDEQD